MKKSIEQEAKTVEEAIELGLASMGVSRDEVSIEVLEKEQKGFLGFGSKLAKVRLTSLYEEAEEEQAEKEPEETVISDDVERLAVAFLSDVFEKMKLEVSIACEKQEHEIKMNLSGAEMGAVIGRRGETLDALQYLTTLAVNKKSEEYYKISLDTENYRSEREKTLQNLAHRLAEKAKRNRRNVSLEPMNAYERKIIHSALQEDEDVHTYSVGEDPNRRIILSPKNAVKRNDYHKRSGNRPYRARSNEQEER